MKTQLALIFSLVTLAAWAQTNSVQISAQTNLFPFLNCASNVIYTNATILSVTPAFADVEFDGGLERVPLQNLPEFLQQRYHYNPTNAAQFELTQKVHAKDQKLAQTAHVAEQERLDAANHSWLLKNGAVFSGIYVSSGTSTVVVNKGGTNYFLTIADLSANDQAYVAQMQLAQRQARLNAEADQMISAGMIEYSVKLIDNFPEKVESQRGWMDAEFVEINSDRVDFPEARLGFEVQDKNNDFYYYCYAEKELPGNNWPNDISDYNPNPLIPVITNLKNGDKVRLVGSVGAISPAAFLSGDYQRFFKVEKVEMIETAAEKKLIEDAAGEKPDISQ